MARSLLILNGIGAFPSKRSMENLKFLAETISQNQSDIMVISYTGITPKCLVFFRSEEDYTSALNYVRRCGGGEPYRISLMLFCDGGNARSMLEKIFDEEFKITSKDFPG